MTHKNDLRLLACVLVWASGAAGQCALSQTSRETEATERKDVASDCDAIEPADADADGDGDRDRDRDRDRERDGTKACESAKEEADGTVIIKDKRSLNRIDRQVYDVDKDPANKTGSTADALKKVPGVNVTASGEVTLHGNAVEILVNGKPSPLFSGENREAALRALPSSAVSSIEVMSNPGAQYDSSSAGAIINIVTKTASPAGMLANVSGQLASVGGYTANAFVKHSRGPFATTATLNLSDYPTLMRNRSTQAELDGNGQPVRSTDNNGVTRSTGKSLFATATLDYDAGAFDTVTGQLDVMKTSSTSRNAGLTTIRDASGAVTDQFESTGTSRFDNQIATIGMGWIHVGEVLGETLKMDAKVTRETSHADSDFLLDYSLSGLLGSGAMRRQPGHTNISTTKSVLGADYNSYVGDDQVTAGVQISRDDTRQDSLIFSPFEPSVGTMAANPLLTSVFDYRQTISAAYVTYQKALGERWIVLGGVRAEAVDYDSQDAISGAPIKVAYTSLNPSLFATYVLSDVQKLRFNYSRRLQRPTPYDLNPSLMYLNDRTVTAGTPALKPQETDAFEASYDYAGRLTSYTFRAYRLNNERVINPVTEIIPDPQGIGRQVVLLSRRNNGSSHQTGLQLAYMTTLSEHWSLNANVDLYAMEMQASDVAARRSLVTTSSQFGVNYTRGKNTVSLSYYGVGKQLTGDGYTGGFGSGSLSWHRVLTPKIDLTVSVSDIFRPRESLFVRDTGDIRMVSASSQRAPVVYVGLSGRFASGSFSATK